MALGSWPAELSPARAHHCRGTPSKSGAKPTRPQPHAHDAPRCGAVRGHCCLFPIACCLFLFNHRQQIILAHDQHRFVIHDDFGAGVGGEQHTIALADLRAGPIATG